MKLQNIFTNNRLLIRLIASFLIVSVLLTGILLIVVSRFVSSKIVELDDEDNYKDDKKNNKDNNGNFVHTVLIFNMYTEYA